MEILLVEDNPDDAHLVMDALRETGRQPDIVHVDNGVRALDFLFGAFERGANSLPAPKVVFLDLKLPRLSGLEVLKQIRSHPRTRTLPVVVFTSSQEHRDISEVYREGANSYVTKPVNFEAYTEVMTKLVDYWTQVNLGPPLAS